VILLEMMNLYVIASDPGTTTTIQGVSIVIWDPGSFQPPPLMYLASSFFNHLG